MLVDSAVSSATMMGYNKHKTKASRVLIVSAATSALMMNYQKASRVLVVLSASSAQMMGYKKHETKQVECL